VTPTSLPAGPFATITADPPWRYEYATGSGGNKDEREGEAVRQYETLTVDTIKRLPVASAAADDAVLWLWVVNAMLPRCLEVVDAWGFSYRGILTWAKTTKDWRTPQFGTGYWLRGATEHAVLAVRGKPPKPLTGFPSWFAAPATGHSRKPEVAVDIFERFSMGPRLELFARRPRHGWTTWGNDDALTAGVTQDVLDFGGVA
jgi:N6-adenosine-specific RNA methylase IME4